MGNTRQQYVWIHEGVAKRNEFGLFRRSFELDKASGASAKLHIFADTFYQIYINGFLAAFGPVRFDPRYPQYDTHELTPYLQKGKNTIAVQVNYCGHKTFMTIASRAGLIAWGEAIEPDGRIIDIGTASDGWRCVESRAYRYSPKASFALKATDLYDQQLEEAGWKTADFDDSSWAKPAILRGKLPWGTLQPRSIPMMSGHDVQIDRVRHVLPLAACEDYYSFEVPMPHYGLHERDASLCTNIWWHTQIYSPKRQAITAGVSRNGEYYLNGVKQPPGIVPRDKSLRQNMRWPLDEGWNDLFGCATADNDHLMLYIALPTGKGLKISADRDSASGILFRHTPVIRQSVYERLVLDCQLPIPPDERALLPVEWVETRAKQQAQSPIVETSWDDYGQELEQLMPDQLEGRVFALEDYPHGFTLLFELSRVHLVLPRIRMLGVKGARIDIVYREALHPDGKHLVQSSHYAVGDRAICSHDAIDWVLTQPRGVKFACLTVRGASRDVTLQSLKLISANYPAKPRGRLNTSDQALNEIWQMGERTLAANMEDVYVDTAVRERGLYIRDAIIQYHITQATFGDHRLMRRCLELIGQSACGTDMFRAVYPNTGNYTISDFSLNAVEGFWDYYAATGDLTIVETYWDELKRNMSWFHDLSAEREDRLLDADWDKRRKIKAEYGGYHGDLKLPPGYMDKAGPNNLFSCTYIMALRCMLKLAEILGDREESLRTEQALDILAKSIDQFWDEDKECYADTLLFTSHSTHANLFPVLAGVVPEERLPRIRKYVTKDLSELFVNGYDPTAGVKFSPSFAFYLLEALYRINLAAVAEQTIKTAWGWVLSCGLDTCPEYFAPNANYSYCHAWSGSPTWHLSRRLLGIHFPVPGQADQLEIHVQAGDVSWVEGAYPHPDGLIEVKWHTRPDGLRVFDYIRTPKSVALLSHSFV